MSVSSSSTQSPPPGYWEQVKNAPGFWGEQFKQAPAYWTQKFSEAPGFWWGVVTGVPQYWTDQVKAVVRACILSANGFIGLDVPALQQKIEVLERENKNVNERNETLLNGFRDLKEQLKSANQPVAPGVPGGRRGEQASSSSTRLELEFPPQH